MKALFKILFLSFLFFSCSEKVQVRVNNLKCEYKVDPLGVDVAKPRFSWNSESSQRSVTQSAYQVLVASDLKNLEDLSLPCFR